VKKKVVFNFRFSTELTVEAIQQRTHAILDKHQLNYQLEWSVSGHPFLTAEGDLVNAALSAIKEITDTQATLSTSGGTSDGRFIAPTGAQVLELGPINATIHKVDEHTSVNDLNALSQIYERMLTHLLV
jgi:succinyl-diaminopimelate desuccinylase